MKKIYLFAAILAVLTGITVFGFTKSLQASSRVSYTEVVAAAVKINDRTVLTKEMLKYKKIPTEAVHPYSLKRIEDAVGLFTDSKYEVDEQLLSSKLHKQGEKTSGLKYYIPEGKRAITIEVNSVSGIGGFIIPGDKVDIIANVVLSKTDGTDQTTPASVMLVQDLEVLAAGTNIKQNSDGTSTSYANVTLAVTPEQALTINFATTNGSIRLLLRSPLDNAIENLKPKVSVLNGNVVG